MSYNPFIGDSKEVLLAYKLQAKDALRGGNQTSAGVEPGVKHEFADKSDKELRQILMDIDAALFLLEPETYPNPEGQKRMKIFTQYS